MKDVAELAGVSIKTVSRVVNNEPLVSDEVVARVSGAIDKIHFQPDQRAGSLRRNGGRQSGMIGVVVSNVANPFAGMVLRTIENAAAGRGVGVLASSTDDDPQRERASVQSLLRRRLDGIIVVPIRASQEYLLAEQSFGTSLVFVDREPVGLSADAIVSDHADGAALATRHLIEHGHRRIAYLGDISGIQSARERQRGFLEELGRNGVPSADCSMTMDLHDEHSAEEATVDLLSRMRPPTAIFSGQNVLTIGVLRGLRRLGLQYSTALIGFDDFPLADLIEPGVSVIAQDVPGIGALAAERLFARIDGVSDDRPRTHVVRTTLISRGSGEIRPLA